MPFSLAAYSMGSEDVIGIFLASSPITLSLCSPHIFIKHPLKIPFKSMNFYSIAIQIIIKFMEKKTCETSPSKCHSNQGIPRHPSQNSRCAAVFSRSCVVVLGGRSHGHCAVHIATTGRASRFGWRNFRSFKGRKNGSIREGVTFLGKWMEHWELKQPIKQVNLGKFKRHRVEKKIQTKIIKQCRFPMPNKGV